MKKTLFVILATWIINAVGVHAQDLPKNVLGLRASYASSWVTSYGVTTSARHGYMFGVIDQIRLTRSLPFYLETGLSFVSKGYEINGFDDSQTSLNYLRIPLGVTYRIALGKSVTIQPNVGLYYSYGISGKLHHDSGTYDVFSDGVMSRSDFGYNLGAGITYCNFYLGIIYETGLTDIAKHDIIYPEYSDMLGYRNLKNKSIIISLGYNFNF